MRNRFDQQLENLNVELITMGALCEEAIEFAMKALFEKDNQMAAKAVEWEIQIDQKERDIETLCMRLLLQQHPVAGDLRVISSAMKMISDMERIGDQAADIAEIAEFLDFNVDENENHLKKMAGAASSMVKASVDSFVNKDLNLAKKVILDDDVVDSYFGLVLEDIVQLIKDNPEKGKPFLDLLIIAKYLERIGDHATNIAEWVVYSMTGSHPVETN